MHKSMIENCGNIQKSLYDKLIVDKIAAVCYNQCYRIQQFF